MPNGDDVTDKKRGFRIEGTGLSKEEHALIAKVADHKGMSINQFVVAACLREARGNQTLDLLAMLVQQMEAAITHQGEASDQQDQMLTRLDELAERQHAMLGWHREALDRLNDLIDPIERTCQGVEHGVILIEKINSCVEDLKSMVGDVERDVGKIEKG